MATPPSASDVSADIVECISVFFTNTFWIAVYNSAVNLHREDREGKYTSLADAYRDNAGRHFKSLSAPADRRADFMGTTLQELYRFCREPLKLDCTFMGFVDLCVKFILPPAHYQSATQEKKIIIFRTVIVKTLSKFTEYVVTRETTIIVDPVKREDRMAMSRCKDEFARIYRAERTHFYNQITAQASGLKAADASTISRELVEKLQNEVHTLMRERAYWQEECNKRNQFCTALKNLVLEKERMIEEMNKVQQVQRQVMKVQRNANNARPPPYVPMGYAPPPQPYYPPPPESVRTQMNSKGSVKVIRQPRTDPSGPPQPPVVENDNVYETVSQDNFDPELEEVLPADA
jgi:hypothetical protein